MKNIKEQEINLGFKKSKTNYELFVEGDTNDADYVMEHYLITDKDMLVLTDLDNIARKCINIAESMGINLHDYFTKNKKNKINFNDFRKIFYIYEDNNYEFFEDLFEECQDNCTIEKYDTSEDIVKTLIIFNICDFSFPSYMANDCNIHTITEIVIKSNLTGMCFNVTVPNVRLENDDF